MNPAEFAALAARLLAPGRFYVRTPLSLRFEPARLESRRWQLYKGELVPPQQTRDVAAFHQASLFADLPGYPCLGPVISLLLSEDGSTILVLRGFAVHGHEAFGEGNVIQTRAAVLWQEERIRTVDATSPRREEESAGGVQAALRGTSRLAITSVESPHPLYAHGLLGLRPLLLGMDAASGHALADLLRPDQDTSDLARSLDFILRLSESKEVAKLAAWLGRTPTLATPEQRARLLATWFTEVALTPDLGQAVKMLQLLRHWLSEREYQKRLSAWLRQLAWHLTAFDLRRFHHQGANYPDALFLDELLRRLCEAIASSDHLESRTASALRLGSWHRCNLDGLAVPSRATSVGENRRVSPLGEPPVPETELVDPGQRSRQLFVKEPFAAAYASFLPLIQKAWAMPWSDEDLLDLGRATFLDRPLGIFKEFQGWRRDQTPLAAYRMVSRSIAQRRLEDAHVRGWLDRQGLRESLEQLSALQISGIAAGDLQLPKPRAGVVCLEDANRVAGDFVVTHSLQAAAQAFLESLDLRCSPAATSSMAGWLMIRSPRARLFAEPNAVFTFFDLEYRPRLEFGLPPEVRPAEVQYTERDGVEFPTCSFRLLHLWDEDGTESEIPNEAANIPMQIG